MPTAAISVYPRFRSWVPATALPNVNGTLQFFAAGTSTPLAVYSDATLATPLANPLTLDANGEALFYTVPGVAYKLTLKDSGGSLIWTEDNVLFPGSGGSSGGSGSSEWVQFAGAPTGVVATFISATSFSLVGDQTAKFEIGRRLQTQNTAGLVYSQIVSSVFAGNTTVTVVNQSPGVLDSGLSIVSYALLDALFLSLPVLTDISVVVTQPFTSAATVIAGVGIAALIDPLTEWNSVTGRITLRRSGNYRATAPGIIQAGGANITTLTPFAGSVFKNGAVIGGAIVHGAIYWPYATGAQTNITGMPFAWDFAAVAGDIIDFRISAPAFTVNTPSWQGVLRLTRAPY